MDAAVWQFVSGMLGLTVSPVPTILRLLMVNLLPSKVPVKGADAVGENHGPGFRISGIRQLGSRLVYREGRALPSTLRASDPALPM